MSRRSAPDENPRPDPRIITARTSSSSAQVWTASRRSAPNWRFQAVMTSGRVGVVGAPPAAAPQAPGSLRSGNPDFRYPQGGASGGGGGGGHPGSGFGRPGP